MDGSRIIPGDWGMVGSGWLTQPLSADRKIGAGGRIHQFLWRRSRAAGTREKGTEQKRAIRSRSDLIQVVQAGFGPERIAVTQRVDGCYCAPARDGRLWRSLQGDLPNERRRKAGQKERLNREGRRAKARSAKTSGMSAMLKTAPLTCERKAT